MIQDAVKVKNPKGVVYWVDRARWPELEKQGFKLVEDPKAKQVEDPKAKQEEAKPAGRRQRAAAKQ